MKINALLCSIETLKNNQMFTQKEIKYRAFDNGKMIYQNQIGLTNNFHQLSAFFSGLSKDAKVMEFTGLQDNNQVDVYEYDVFQVVYKDCPDGYSIMGRETKVILINAVVVFKYGTYCVKFMHPEQKEIVYMPLFDFLKNNNQKVVLGNPFENADLQNID